MLSRITYFAVLLTATQAGHAGSPLRFEPNVGQAAPQVRAVARGAGYTMMLSAREAILKLPSGTVRMNLNGASSTAPQPTGLLPSVTNYYSGSDPTRWRSGVTNYERVKFPQVYPGIDLVYYGNQRQLEYDFVVAPGADPKQIRATWTGADSLRLDRNGDLVLSMQGRELHQHKPLAYQDIKGERITVGARYKLEKGELRLALSAYDHKFPLVVDPVLIYSTYIGGPTEDEANGITVDSTGATYITGSTGGAFPTLNPEQSTFGGETDAFVTKLSPTGTLVYSTYLGGPNTDSGSGIAVDTLGNAYITGYTEGSFPLLNAAQSTFAGTPVTDTNAFVTMLGPTGALVYSTYLGGPNSYAAGIAVDSTRAAYVTGQTIGLFPVLNAQQPTYGGGLNDAFVAKLDDTGAFVYATYLGGPNSDFGTGIAVDSTGAAYVVGNTAGGFPVVDAEQTAYGGGGLDVFVAKLSPAGTVVYATYLGGTSLDYGTAIAVDSTGAAYVAGQTSGDFPVLNAQQPTYGGGGANAFVTKFAPSGTLSYSTYLGGAATDDAAAIAVDSTGAAYITGATGPGFPLLNAEQTAPGSGSSTVFVTKLTPAGAISYSTYLGGNIQDGGSGIAVDSTGAAYITGSSAGAFPILNAEQPIYGGGFADAFVVKLSATGVPPFYLSATSTHNGNFGQGQNSATYTLTVTNAVTSSTATSGVVTVTELLPPDLTLVSMTGAGWNCTSNVCSRSDALSPGASYPLITVTVNVSGLASVSLVNIINVAAGSIAVTAADPTTVNLAPPFGSFDSPAAPSTNVNGSVAFTGWALSSTGISLVDIWRNPNPGEPTQSNGLVYIGAADIVPGSRPDVDERYPNYPGANSAGWGYLLLSNELPANNGNTTVGNGTYNIHAIAHDQAGNRTDLGTKTIVVDNKDATVPFGTIDTPVQGGTVSGTIVNFGWALTPPGKMIPTDGSTIWVFIDNLRVGHPVYNQYRLDIATLFPNYANSGGAVGYYYIDTTQLANGLHTISWSVTDNEGSGSGIGSRYFTVQN
jgi:hypothetical protein